MWASGRRHNCLSTGMWAREAADDCLLSLIPIIAKDSGQIGIGMQKLFQRQKQFCDHLICWYFWNERQPALAIDREIACFFATGWKPIPVKRGDAVPMYSSSVIMGMMSVYWE